MQPENRQNYRALETELRNFDPIETVNPQFDDAELLTTVSQDIVTIDDILASDQQLTTRERQDLYAMGVDLRLDWLYAKHGGQQATTAELGSYLADTQQFINKGIEHAQQYAPHHPQLVWGLKMRKFDLWSASAHRFARESQTVLQGTEAGEKLWGDAERLTEQTLGVSLALMKEMGSMAQGHSKLASDARGSLYELMVLTYARSEVYEHQDLDKTMVRAALSREDRPWNDHAYPKRSFDMLIQHVGEDPELLQAKNYDNGDQYAAPIRKVQDEHFGQTLRELPTYIRDFEVMLRNSPDPHLKSRVDMAARRLDDVFGAQLASH